MCAWTLVIIASSLLELVIIALDFDLIYISKTFERMSRELRSYFILTCVCDLLPCTTEEFHLSMDEVVDNESHCSQITRLTFYLIWLVSGTLVMRNFFSLQSLFAIVLQIWNVTNAMFVAIQLVFVDI